MERPSTGDITTALDLAGLLAVAAGVGAWSASRIGWAGLAVAGAIVLAGSAYISTVSRPGYVPVRRRLAAANRRLWAPVRAWRMIRRDARHRAEAVAELQRAAAGA